MNKRRAQTTKHKTRGHSQRPQEGLDVNNPMRFTRFSSFAPSFFDADGNTIKNKKPF